MRIFKATVFICILCLLLGCSGVSVRVDPTTGIWTADYWRLGNQEFKGLTITKTGGDITVSLDSQKATDESLQELIRMVRQLSLDGVVRVPN